MTQVKKYPRAFTMTGKSTYVTVTFVKTSEGREHVEVAVLSKALPDERQVTMQAQEYEDGYVVTAEQELPKPREPDPEKIGREIRGDLHGKYAVLQQKFFPGDIPARVVQLTGGFGCYADGIGRKVFGKYVIGGRDFAGRREDVKRFATEAEIDAARAATPL